MKFFQREQKLSQAVIFFGWLNGYTKKKLMQKNIYMRHQRQFGDLRKTEDLVTKLVT